MYPVQDICKKTSKVRNILQFFTRIVHDLGSW